MYLKHILLLRDQCGNTKFPEPVTKHPKFDNTQYFG